MSVTITSKTEYLAITFTFEENFDENYKKVKSLLGSKWDRTKKVWQVPCNQVSNVIRLFSPETTDYRNENQINELLKLYPTPPLPGIVTLLNEEQLEVALLSGVNPELFQRNKEACKSLKGKYSGESKSWLISSDIDPKQLIKTFPKETYRYIPPDLLEQLEQIHALKVEEIKAIAARRQGKFSQEKVTIPEVLPNGWQLKAFQKEGVAWLLQHQILHNPKCPGGILGYEMGLGKTLTSLIAAWLLQTQYNDLKILIVAPPTLKPNWANLTKDLGINNVEIHSDYYTKIPKEQESDFILICDEAHRYKSVKAARTKNLKNLAYSKHCLGTWLLSGTPLKNGEAQSLVSLLQILRHPLVDTFPKVRQFEESYCNGHYAQLRYQTVWQCTGVSRASELHQLLKPLMLRKLQKEVLVDLPPLTRIFKKVELRPKAEKAYVAEIKEIAKAFILRIKTLREDGYMREAANLANAQAIVTLTKIRQVGSTYKVAAVVEDAYDLTHTQNSVLIFTEFLETITKLKQSLPEALIIAGKTSQQNRELFVEQFQQGEAKLLIGTSAMEVGLNLFKANYVLHLDRPQTAESLAQRTKRIHRLGQEKPCFSYWYQLGYVDNRVDKGIAIKQHNADRVLDGAKPLKYSLEGEVSLAMEILEHLA